MGGTNNGYGGTSMVCITFVASFDAAIAFANSLYGGNWQS